VQTAVRLESPVELLRQCALHCAAHTSRLGRWTRIPIGGSVGGNCGAAAIRVVTVDPQRSLSPVGHTGRHLSIL
jgi:hypothetical protein